LAFTHRKITWVGVIPRRLAAFPTAASTGPPGKVVIDLNKKFIQFHIVKQVKYERKTSISLSDDAVFRMIFQKRCTFGIIIWVQLNLSWESNSRLSSDHNGDEGEGIPG
jgi:hypothetical protein